MTKKRHIAPPIYLAEALELGIELEVGNGFGVYTANGSTVPFKTIPAGSYSFGDFVDYVAQQLAAYIFDDFASGASLPVNVGTVDNKILTLSLETSTDYNATLIDFLLSNISATVGGATANIQDCILKAGWPHLLGLGLEGDDINCTIGGGEASAAGLFQARGIYTFLRSENYPGGRLGTDLYEVLPLGDGDADTWRINNAIDETEYTFIDHDFHVTGRPVHLGTLDSTGGGGAQLFFANPKRVRTPGIEETGLQTDRVVVGQYVYIRGAGSTGWVSRVKEVTANAAPTKHQILLWESIPSTHVITAPSPVYKVSEAWAMAFDAIERTQSRLLFYDADDQTGTARHTCEEWVLSSATQEQLRRSIGLDRWSKTIRGIVKRKMSLTKLLT
jgi:hypothetical protein